MCGIAGYISFSKDGQAQAPLLQRMLSQIAHRGPDGKNIHVYPQAALAHARLKILDLSDNASQPFVGTTHTHALVYNGEIYNHLAIREKLKFQDFQTHSDTETLFYALQEFGETIIPQLNGIFSFVFLDLTNFDAIVARDRYGVKPLHYYLNKDGFYFASEIKALLQIDTLDLAKDWEAYNEYIALLNAQGGKTAFKFIKALPPAHYMFIDATKGTVSLKEFWAIPKQRSYVKDSTETIIQTTEDLLIAAVQRQLVADVSVGFFLSGGLDSSLLVAIAQKHGHLHRPQCYTIKQDTSSWGFNDDYPYAQSIAQALDWDLYLVEKPQLDHQALDRMVDIIDAPILDLSALNVEAIAKEAQRSNNKVLISGLGADDIFTGYRRHTVTKIHSWLKNLPLHSAAKLAPLFPEYSNTKRWLYKFAEAWHSDPDIFLSRLHLYTSKSYLPISQDLNNPEEYLMSFLKKFDKNVDSIDKALALELYSYLPLQNLIYTDMASMKHGVEVRVPYLDNELTDYLFHIPPKLKMRGFVTKYILRKIATNYLPRQIINRKKVGFSEVLPPSLSTILCERITGKYQHIGSTDFASNPQLLLNLYAVSRFIDKY